MSRGASSRRVLPGLMVAWLGACAPVEPSPEPAVAGRSRRDAVVGGTEAPEEGAVVALVARRVRCANEPLTLLCSGTLIAPDVVLTAAHCLEIFGPDGAYELFLGERLLPEPQGRFVRVMGALRHPAYDPVTHAHDVALLRLVRPVEVSPLPLPGPEGDGLERGRPVRVVGFGDTKEAGAPSGQRRQGAMAVTQVERASFHAAPAPAMSCVGDSGGPVLVRGADGREVLAGITVSGDVACRKDAFHVRVEAVLEDFILPFLAERPAPPGEALALGALCTAACTRDAECPSGLDCVMGEEGSPGRCLLHALQEGDYGEACSEDAQCGGGGVCARLEPEGEAACRCFTPCPVAPDEVPEGCTGSPGSAALAWLGVAGWLGGWRARSARRAG